ncbi:M23 family metallopeptidase [Fusibacter ferrireducens]|uniref:M23 family metallopeptidase n=1 Tax=Fusibacter ferrireducens TaxID=2785058 RepID=A0ABR9ZP18_9FIRM|nr:M23 family metallopeptidase [Fusibacter ferrireducens]MBF4692061.1 M23 family metallopeptidase [Fusibacter ferrireducens]
MIDEIKSYIMAFPLRGEWLTPNTPGTKVPSHGTNKFGTRYAVDFIQVDWKRKGWPSYKLSTIKYLMFGLPMEAYYCWEQPIFSPCDGTVVQVCDGYNEPKRTNLWRDMYRASVHARYFDASKNDIQSIAGNFVIIKFEERAYVALIHLRKDSIRVKEGQSIKKGAIIGRVGHSGNSYMPHLHFQLMDSIDINKAQGLPFVFDKYDIYVDGEWQEVRNCIPKGKDRIRFIE